MNARFIRFGEVEIDGKRYQEDVVIEQGTIREREKQGSRRHKARYGHTPLSTEESIPWSCTRLLVGTGANGRLPITEDVHSEARRRGVEIVAVPTDEACRLLNEASLETTNAVLHLTC